MRHPLSALLVLLPGILLSGCTVVEREPPAGAAPGARGLTELLEDRSGLQAYRSSTPAPEQAELLILGGVHLSRQSDDEITPGTFDLPFTLEGILREEDTLLLECSRDLMTPYESTVRGVQVRVAGIDCSRELKVAHLQETIHEVVLAVARDRLEVGAPLHPFHPWLIHEDLRLVSSDAAELLALLRQRGSQGRADRERHHQMVANVVDAARRLGPRRRAVLIVGEQHLTGYGHSLLQALEDAGVRYASYVTPEGRRSSQRSAGEAARLDTVRSGNLPAAQPAPVTHSHRQGGGSASRSPGMTYFEERVLPRYVRERAAEGVEPYEGSYEGALRQ